MMKKEYKYEFSNPSLGQLVSCRGGTWKYIGQENGFWHLELVKQGTQFSEEVVKVWILPNLEKATLELLNGSDSLAPRPNEDQIKQGNLFRPLLNTQKNHALQDATESKIPDTAMNCAIEHKDWQFEPWRRVVDELPFPRILIADDVGLGKTTEAAIILAELTRRRRADRVLIVSPQHLTDKWQDELYERFGLAFEIFDRDTRVRLMERGVKNPWELVEKVIVSRDFLKRWENLKPLQNVDWDMIVIDECHHFVRDKNQAPTRLRQLAEEIVYRSPGLIMLSATPFTGSEEEFHSLLNLIDPKFHDKDIAGRWDPRNPHLIRRLKGNVEACGEEIKQRKIHEILVTEDQFDRLEKTTMEQVHQELASESSREGREYWDRLLEETARKRLSSGWRAFHDTVVGSERLRSWFKPETIKAVSKLVEKKDSAKLRQFASHLRALHNENGKAKVVVFTEALPTQEDVASYLVDQAGYRHNQVATIASGTPKSVRMDIEEKFANKNSPLLVLIATDTISEGKDLQHACHHLIHFELPWSLVKIEQRNGRIDRLGQKKTPQIYNLVLDTPATPDQRVMNRLLEKLEVARQSLGSVSPITARFEEFDKVALFDNPEAIEKEIETVERETQKLGFDLSGATPLSANTLQRSEDSISRQANFALMLKFVGGSMRPFDKLEHQYLMSLPPGWDLPGLFTVSDNEYPAEDSPWRVTFSPTVFLEYEEYRRNHGEAKQPLHFISPVHPVAVQLESRFRGKVGREGYPVFSVRDMIRKHVVLAELTVRSKSSRIMMQRLVAFDCKNLFEIHVDLLGEFKAAGKVTNLPSKDSWAKVTTHLGHLAETYAKEANQAYKKRFSAYEKEQNQLPKDLAGVEQRANWLSELWEVDPSQSQFQVVCLLVKEA